MRAWNDVPVGARAALSAVPAGDQDSDGRARWKAAAAAHKAALRRRTGRRKAGYRAGMARRPPPPDGDDAA